MNRATVVQKVMLVLCAALVVTSSVYLLLPGRGPASGFAGPAWSPGEERKVGARLSAEAEAVVEAFERTASSRHVPEESVEVVSVLLKGALWGAEIYSNADAMVQFGPSLESFLQEFRWALADNETREGTEYWLAFCIARAVVRPGVSGAQAEELQKHYRGLVEEAAGLIEQGVRSGLPAKEQEAMGALVAEGLQHFRDETTRRMGTYTGDYLCPGFKRKVDEQLRQKILSPYRNRGNYPKYEQPRDILATTGEAFRGAYRRYIENTISMFLFDVFINTLGLDPAKTEYWGYMNYKAQSLGSRVLASEAMWPALVRFVPNEGKNKERLWKRNSQDRVGQAGGLP